MNTLTIGETPVLEDWIRQDDPNYVDKARKECKAYINQIRRKFGPEPPNTKLKIGVDNHQGKVYLAVVIEYDENDNISTEYAERVDSDFIDEWDQQARIELAVN